MNTRSSFVQAQQIHSTFSCCVLSIIYMVLRCVEITARLFIAVTFSWMAAAGTVCHACDATITLYTTMKTEENTLFAKLASTITLFFGFRRFTRPGNVFLNCMLLSVGLMHLYSLWGHRTDAGGHSRTVFLFICAIRLELTDG